MITTDIEKANHFATYFYSIFNKSFLPGSFFESKNTAISKLSFIDISEIDVYEKLVQLQSKQNTSPDYINNYLLKNVQES